MTAAATRSDEELLEALLDGDVRGFDLLHARYERPLFAFIRRHHPQQQEAEDLLHETFLALLRDRVAARAATNLRAWLFQVARHLCLNRHRAQRRAAGALADPAVTRAPLPEPHPERIPNASSWATSGGARSGRPSPTSRWSSPSSGTCGRAASPTRRWLEHRG